MNLLHKPQTRYGAFAWHLLISLLIFIVLAAIIVYVWFPGFMFDTDGGWQGIRIIAGVDFIIGPILTLIVYKVDKPSLKFDMAAIAVVQMACLAAGIYIVNDQKPLAVVYANGTYHTMSADSFTAVYDLDYSEIYKYGEATPVWIYARLPEDKEKRSEVLRNQLEGYPLNADFSLYTRYADHLPEILSQSIDLATVDESIQAVIPDTSALFKFRTRYAYGLIEIDRTTGREVGLHDVTLFDNPFE